MSKYEPSFMKEALVVAQEAYDNLEVPVGCVFVLNNEAIIARGRNKPNESYNVKALQARKKKEGGEAYIKHSLLDLNRPLDTQR